MRSLFTKAILIGILSFPMVGYCSYWQEAEKYGEHFQDYEGPKCLILIDLIKNEKDSAKRDLYKSLLHVNLLASIDHEDKWIEYYNKSIQEGIESDTDWAFECIRKRESHRTEFLLMIEKYVK